ncbi:MAG: hypothetical protein RSE18_17715, partial [Acinetobacter sp.]
KLFNWKKGNGAVKRHCLLGVTVRSQTTLQMQNAHAYPRTLDVSFALHLQIIFRLTTRFSLTDSA